LEQPFTGGGGNKIKSLKTKINKMLQNYFLDQSYVFGSLSGKADTVSYFMKG
jgi:hypothetical protein